MNLISHQRAIRSNVYLMNVLLIAYGDISALLQLALGGYAIIKSLIKHLFNVLIKSDLGTKVKIFSVVAPQHNVSRLLSVVAYN